MAVYDSDGARLYECHVKVKYPNGGIRLVEQFFMRADQWQKYRNKLAYHSHSRVNGLAIGSEFSFYVEFIGRKPPHWKENAQSPRQPW